MTREPWLLVAGGLVVGGLLFGSATLWQLGLIVALIGGVGWAWARVALRGVRYERALSADHAFVGDTLTLAIRLTNDKLLPLTWLAAADNLPEGLVIDGLTLGVAERPRYLALRHAATLLPYDRLTWTYTLNCPARGIYTLGPVTLTTGDPFGLNRVSVTDSSRQRLVVYPTLLPLAELGLPAAAPLGELPDRRSLERDPLRPVGVRPYEPSDSRRAIDWRATARLGALHVREFEPVSRLTTVVVLNVATFDTVWIGVDPLVQERLIQVAGALASSALEQGRMVGLVTNGCPPGVGRVARVPPSDNPDARRRILEVLAGVTAFVSVPVERLLLRESRVAPWGATLVVVTSVMSEGLAVALLRVRRSGRQVVLVSLDPDYAGQVPGIKSYHLAPLRSEPASRRTWQTGWMADAQRSEGRPR